MSFVHLNCQSAFSFLRSASDVKTLAAHAANLGMSSLGLTDRNTVAGVYQFQRACHEVGVKPIVGATLSLPDDRHVVLIAQNATGYQNLCHLLSDAHLENDRNDPSLPLDRFAGRTEGLVCLTGSRRGVIGREVIRGDEAGAIRTLDTLSALFPGRCYVELQRTWIPGDRVVNRRLRMLAERIRTPVVASNNVRYVHKSDFPLCDAMNCIRVGAKIDEPHPERPFNAEQYLKPSGDMARVFRNCPEAIANTRHIAESVEAIALGGRAYLPRFPFLGGQSAVGLLRQKVYEGARRRYRDVSPSLRRRIDHELDTITALGFADYFLIVADVVEIAAQKGIRFAGRGSAADSVVAYCLRVTNVDAHSRDHTFERFMSRERRNSLPDVDIDFDARYRDTIAAYVTQTYGEDKTAACAIFHTYGARGAVRELGKVLGFPEASLRTLAKRLPSFSNAGSVERLLDELPELRALNLPVDRFEMLFQRCSEIAGLPRHIGTHASGIIVTGLPIQGVAPLQRSAKGVNIIPFDKVDVEDMGLVKLDFLHLRMLSAVEDAMQVVSRKALLQDEEPLAFEAIPLDDDETYRMINRGDATGAFQLESPPQQILQVRAHAKNIEDIIQSVAAIRPGPIKGEMVEPWIRRREGKEAVTPLLPELEPVLGRTYGVLLFQEQVIDICVVVAGFTPGEADLVRRALTRRRTRDEMDTIRRRFIEKAMARGYDRAKAEEVFSWVEAFGGYGFPEGHSAAWGDTAYRTAYLLCHHPAEYFAGMLSNQPMGFWPSGVLIQEAKRHGVRMLGLDINESREACVGREGVIRAGWTTVKGISAATGERMTQERQLADFSGVVDFARRVLPKRDELESLVTAGAFDAIHPNRRALLWRLAQADLSVEAPPDGLDIREPRFSLPDIPSFSDAELCRLERMTMGFSARWHPMEFFREELTRRNILSCQDSKRGEHGEWRRVAGLLACARKPPTKSGALVVFLTLGDETGMAHVTMFDSVYQEYGNALYARRPILVEGRLDRERGRTITAERVDVLGS